MANRIKGITVEIGGDNIERHADGTITRKARRYTGKKA